MKMKSTAKEALMEKKLADEGAGAWSDAHGWTKVEDDTGGGSSLTNFEILYVQGDASLAAAAIEALFDVSPASGSKEYGPALSFKYSDSFAEASWFERGCDYDRSARKPIEARAPGSWRRDYHAPGQWIGMCEASIEEAQRHSADWLAPRGGKMFLCRRTEALSMALRSRIESADHNKKGEWARELLDELRQRPLSVESPNRMVVGKALSHVFAVATRIAQAACLGDEERPEEWAITANTLRGEDFAMARLLVEDVEKGWLSEIDRAQLRLLLYPEPSSAISSHEVLSGAGADVIERLLAICKSDVEFSGIAEAIPALEAAALERLVDGVELGGSRAIPRL